jgi:hypothetical protein
VKNTPPTIYRDVLKSSEQKLTDEGSSSIHGPAVNQTTATVGWTVCVHAYLSQ